MPSSYKAMLTPNNAALVHDGCDLGTASLRDAGHMPGTVPDTMWQPSRCMHHHWTLNSCLMTLSTRATKAGKYT